MIPNTKRRGYLRLTFLLAIATLVFCNLSSAQRSGATEAHLLFSGNFPDPTILLHDETYYITHSSFNYRPGLLIWASKDLKHWTPVTYALKNFRGNVWAPELVRHNGIFYIYFPSVNNGRFENWVVTSDDIRGPWSEPHAIGVGHIDPGHVTGADGRRYLHLSGGHAAQLSENGLRANNPPQKVHNGWPIPKDWAIECFCLESPKLTKRNGWYYLTAAQGGTFGPSTSHMITLFRSTTPLGPWEDAPHNPIIHTYSRKEGWWSKGHGTPFEGPNDQWYMVLHGIPNGYRTLGRSTLIEPIVWQEDGWYHVQADWPLDWREGTLHLALSDPFKTEDLGLQWQFYQQKDDNRLELSGGILSLRGIGDHPGNSMPMTVIARDKAYTIETEVESFESATAGLMLFVSDEEFIGLSINSIGQIRRAQSGYKRYHNTQEPKLASKKVAFRIVNDHQDVRFYLKTESSNWQIMQPSMDISQNGIVRPALFVYGNGKAHFEYFKYEKLGN